MGIMDFFKKGEPTDLNSQNSSKREDKLEAQKQTRPSRPIHIPLNEDVPRQQLPTVSIPEEHEFKGFNLQGLLIFDSSEESIPPRGSRHSFTPKPLYEKRPVIILAVENTAKVCDYQPGVLRVMKKVIEDNKNALFLFLRYGNNSKNYEVLDFERLKSENLPECLLDTTSLISEEVNLVAPLNHISEFIKSFEGFFNRLKYDNTSYLVEDIRIIFIGTGSNTSSPAEANILLKELRANKMVKAIKYFCIKDENAVQIAANGFPVIGHIEPNFYK